MQTSAVTGSSAHWPALCITAAFYLTTIPERFGFQRQFFFFSVYNATEHFHQDYEPTTTHTVWIRGGKVLSVSQRVQLSSSACRFQWKVQPHGSTHDTPAQYWRRTMEGGNYACGGGGEYNNHPHICGANYTTPMMLMAQWVPAFSNTVWKLEGWNLKPWHAKMSVVFREPRATCPAGKQFPRMRWCGKGVTFDPCN